MQAINRLYALFAISAALCSVAPSQQHANTKERKALVAALRAKKGVVLIVASAQPDSSSPGYSEWYDHFTDFDNGISKDKTVEVVVLLGRAEYAQIVGEPKIKGDFATLFLADATHGLLYDGPLVEPADYKIGTSFLKIGKIEDKALPPYGLKKVAVRLK